MIDRTFLTVRQPWLFLAAGIVMAGLLAWSAAHFSSFRQSARDLAAFEAVSGEVRRLDEVLTMSAMMGAATADPQWKARYDRHVALLDEALSQALALGGPEAKAMVSEVADSNRALISMETTAFDLSQKGRTSAALSTMQSARYREEKVVYAQGVERALSVGRAHAQASEEAAFVSLVALLVLAALSSVTALFFWQRRLSEQESHRARVALMNKEQERQEAEKANRAKSQFLATMSHELRTPLNAVIGYAEILEEDLSEAGNAQGAGDAQRIRRAARNLLHLINEVLDFSKIEAGRLELHVAPCDVGAIVHEVCELTRHIEIANANTVRISVPAMPQLELDGARLRQCLLNLVSNAAKFTKGGEIAVEARLLGEGRDAVLEIAVSDTGVGIAKEQLQLLFEPFVQVDSSHTRKHEGTGLGLAITRRLAETMGGDVVVQSALGEGSRFTLRVAARVPTCVPETGANETRPVILVIEDEVAARDLTERALERLPLRLHMAADAKAGLAALELERPALIVLDLHLPDISGWDVMARLKADPSTANIPILVVTIDDDRARALASGACDHLLKPVNRGELTAAVLRYARLAPGILTEASARRASA